MWGIFPHVISYKARLLKFNQNNCSEIYLGLMSDAARKKMPKYLIKNFVISRADPNDR